MAKKATRKAKTGDGAIGDLELEALRAENLHLKEEIERLRLRNAGAHPAAALAEALRSADEAGDSTDDAMTIFASSMVIRSELLDLLALFKTTIADFEDRLDRLGDPELTVDGEAADTDLRMAIETSLSALEGGRTDSDELEDMDEDGAPAHPAAKGA